MHHNRFFHFLRIPFIWICVFFFCINTRCKAQDNTLIPGTDTAMISHLMKIAAKLTDHDSALRLYDKALLLSKDGKYTDGIINALDGIAVNYYSLGDYEQSLNS